MKMRGWEYIHEPFDPKLRFEWHFRSAWFDHTTTTSQHKLRWANLSAAGWLLLPCFHQLTALAVMAGGYWTTYMQARRFLPYLDFNHTRGQQLCDTWKRYMEGKW